MNKLSSPLILWDAARIQADNNCACSAAEEVAPQPLPQQGLWRRVAQLHTAALPEGCTLLFSPQGAAGPVVVDAAALRVLEDYARPRALDGAAAELLAGLGLLCPEGADPQLRDAQPATLTAWLHVTNACNLRCVYCYIEKSQEAMNEQTGLAAVDAVFRSAVAHGFRRVKLKYAGGEATLNFRLVQRLHAHAQQRAHETGLDLYEVVLSNGVALSNAMLGFLRNEGIGLMVSLDGAAEEHDRQRVLRNGRGSHQWVVRGIERALAQGVRPHLSITVTGRSVDGVARAVAFALERDLYFNLNFYRDHDPKRSHAELRAEDERLVAAMRAAFAEIEARLPAHSLIGALVDRASFAGPHHRSCGAGHDYLVVDQRGRVARCQMEIERTVTDVLAPDPLAHIRLAAEGFQNRSVDEKEGCRQCQWRYWCAGGCSLLTYLVTRRNDVKSPYCNVYKALYPEVLRLEGLRLLKWRDRA